MLHLIKGIIMFIELFLITGVIIGISFLALGFSIFIKKDGKFPSYEIGKNKEMRKLGITCAKHDELKCHRQPRKGNPCDCS